MSNITDDAVISKLVAGIHFGEFYLPLIILAFGLPGNILGMLIMLKLPDNRSRPTCIFMGALSVVDFLIMAISLFLYWLFFNFLRHTPFQWACTIFRFLVQYLTQLSAYILVAMTADRFLSIRFPLRSRAFSTTRNATRVVLALVVSLFLINMHGFWTYRLVDLPDLGHKKCLFVSSVVGERIFSAFMVLLATAIPFLSLILLNIGLVVTLTTRQEIGESGSGDPESAKRKAATQRQITRSLLLVSLVFLLLTAPYRADEMAWRFVQYQKSPVLALVRRLCYSIFHKLWYVNSAVNFYIYVLSVKKFRQDLLQLFGCSTTSDGSNSKSSNSSYLMRTIRSFRRQSGS